MLNRRYALFIFFANATTERRLNYVILISQCVTIRIDQCCTFAVVFHRILDYTGLDIYPWPLFYTWPNIMGITKLNIAICFFIFITVLLVL